MAFGPNPSGKPKGWQSMKTRMRAAFGETRGEHNLVNVLLRIAENPEDPRCLEAIKIALAYGFGLPQRHMTDQMIEGLVQRRLEEAIAAARQPQLPAIEVTSGDTPPTS